MVDPESDGFWIIATVAAALAFLSVAATGGYVGIGR